MKALIGLLIGTLVSVSAFAGFGGYNGTTNLGVFQDVKCSTGLTCTKVGGKLQLTTNNQISASVVAATATTITAAQCGSTFYNTAAVQMELPEASTVIGCELHFVTLNASNFDLNPDTGDIILVAANAAGDAIRNATLGNNITIKAVSASQWVVKAQTGTYTDIN